MSLIDEIDIENIKIEPDEVKIEKEELDYCTKCSDKKIKHLKIFKCPKEKTCKTKPERNFMCDQSQCKKYFATFKSLKRHKRKFHSIKVCTGRTYGSMEDNMEKFTKRYDTALADNTEIKFNNTTNLRTYTRPIKKPRTYVKEEQETGSIDQSIIKEEPEEFIIPD